MAGFEVTPYGRFCLTPEGTILHDRQRVVDSLLQLKKGTSSEEIHAKAAAAPPSKVRIKRYRNE
jgi:putative transposase